MSLEARKFHFLNEIHILAAKHGLKIVKEPEVEDGTEAEQDTKPAPYIPDNDVDYHG